MATLLERKTPTNSQFGGGGIPTIDYISARGTGVPNGTGLLGNNYNFGAYTFDPTIAPNLPGSFTYAGYYPGITSVVDQEFFKVDPNQVYRLTCYLYQQPKPGFEAFTYGERHYHNAGLLEYDIDKNQIGSDNHVIKSGSRTELTQSLNVGDTQIHVADATAWENVNANGFYRALSIFGYKNSSGFQYDYYTRLVENDLWDVGSVDTTNNIITLNKPLPASMGNPDGGAWAIGTKVANKLPAATFKYSVLAGSRVTEVGRWDKFTAWVGGIDISGTNKNLNFSPGTAFVKFFTLPNLSNRVGGFSVYPDTGPDHEVKFAGIDIFPDTNATAYKQSDGHWDIYRANIPEGGTVTAVQMTSRIQEQL